MRTQRRGLHGFPLYGTIVLLYWLGYAGSAFLSAFLAENEIPVAVVGAIMSAVNCIGVFSSPMMGNWADRLGNPRKVFLTCALGTGITMLLVPFGIRYAVMGFSLVIPLYISWAIFCRPMSGLCDGWILNVIDNGENFSYSAMRRIGSFGYALMCVVYSAAAKWYGNSDIIFFIYAALCAALVFFCFYARRDDAPVKREKGKKIGVRAVLGHYHLIVYLICHCLLNLPMYCSTTFIPYKLIEVTGSTGSLGNVTAFRSLAEIPGLMIAVWLIKKIGMRKSLSLVMLLFAAVQILFIGAQGVPMVTAAMIIMGCINGIFVGSQIRYVHEIAPPEAATSAISLCVSMALICAVFGNAVGGILVDAFGTIAYFIFAGASVLLALLIFVFSVPVGKRLGHPLPDNIPNL
ncbi:MAG: MFS transporter [Clostridia bacterium]|nr:MFS transporter [Clostridia bacterium]